MNITLISGGFDFEYHSMFSFFSNVCLPQNHCSLILCRVLNDLQSDVLHLRRCLNDMITPKIWKMLLLYVTIANKLLIISFAIFVLFITQNVSNNSWTPGYQNMEPIWAQWFSVHTLYAYRVCICLSYLFSNNSLISSDLKPEV